MKSKTLGMLLAAASALLMVGCHGHRSQSEASLAALSDQPTTATSMTAPELEKFAVAVVHRYTAMKSLQFTASVRHDDDEIVVHYAAEPTRFRSDVFTKAGDAYASFLLRAGMMTEFGNKMYASDGSARWQQATYKPPIPAGIADPRYNMPLGCMYGRYTETWVGPDSTLKDMLARRIRAATSITQETWEGVRCTVVNITLDGGDRADSYWFDSTHVLRRWTSNESGLHRDRCYRNMIIDGAIAPETWRIEAPKDINQPLLA